MSDIALADEQSDRGVRKLSGIPAALQRGLAITIPLIGIGFIIDLPYHLATVTFFDQQYLGLFLALILPYLFLSVPAHKTAAQDRVPWYDWAFALICLTGGGYVALFYDQLLLELGLITSFKVWLGGLFIISILEAIRRLIGWVLLTIVVVFILYGRFGFLMPGVLATREVGWSRLVNQLYLDSEFLFGTPLQVAGVVVLSFILFGRFLLSTGGSTFLTNLAESVMGRFRGGPAKIAIMSSALFGTLSGTAVGNVAAVGTITIPMMIRSGYSASFAAAVEAAASTGGCIMPPIMGAAAFIMAELVGVPYRQVAWVAVVPALLYFLGIYMQVDLRAARRGLKGLSKRQLPSARKTLVEGWHYLVPVAVLLWVLFVWDLRAEVSALYSLAALIILTLLRRSNRASLKETPQILEGVTRGMLEVAVICAGAGIIVGVVNYTGLGQSLSRFLTGLGGGELLPLALLTALTSSILGMGMPVTASYLFLAVLVVPAMVGVGVDPLLAHMFVFYYGTYSFLTPPVCVAVFTAASIARAPVYPTAMQALKLAAAGYIVPFIFLYKPSMVLIGEPLAIALSVMDALLAVFVLAIAVEGYFRRQLGGWERAILIVASLSFFVPGSASRVVGLTLLVAISFYDRFASAAREARE